MAKKYQQVTAVDGTCLFLIFLSCFIYKSLSVSCMLTNHGRGNAKIPTINGGKSCLNAQLGNHLLCKRKRCRNGIVICQDQGYQRPKTEILNWYEGRTASRCNTGTVLFNLNPNSDLLSWLPTGHGGGNAVSIT